jgi:hypothetical protein
MLSLSSWKNEKDKQTIVKEFHGSLKPSVNQLTSYMVTIDGRQGCQLE